MTNSNKISQKYQKGIAKDATLKKRLIPEFLGFINNQDFKLKQALDIGCGNGKYLVYLKDLGFKTDGLDYNPLAVDMACKALDNNTSVICRNFYDYDLPDNKYDLIISISALHHGLKTQVMGSIKQIYQALIPGGFCFITLPDNEGGTHWTTMSHHNEVEPGTRVPLNGHEKDLPHSSYTREEINQMFGEFKNINLQLLSDRGRWIIIGEK